MLRSLCLCLLGTLSSALLGGCPRSTARPDGCRKDADCKGERVCNDGACEEPPARPAAPSGAGAGMPPGGAIAPRELREGWSRNNRFVPRFSASRRPADAGLAFLTAAARCRARGLAVCTELQLERACAAEPGFGEVESWTATQQGAGLVLLGPGCAGRRTAHAADLAPGRAAACCSRAVALETDVRGPGWLDSTGPKLQAYERASTSAELLPLLAPKVGVNALELPGPLVAAKLDGLPAGSWTQLDTCALSADLATDTWTADCSRLVARGGSLTGGVTRLVWSGEGGVLVRLQEKPGTVVALAP